MKFKLNKLLRPFTEPLIQFLLVGGCIYGAYAYFGTPEENVSEAKIHIDSKRINAFVSEWESRWNRPPTRQEVDGLIQQYVREEVLYRQAVEMGLNENDPITRRRMAQKLDFLTSDLAQMKQPAEGELENYFADNAADYRAPDQITFSQVFFDPDARGKTTHSDAEAALVTLKVAGVPDAKTLDKGDAMMLQGYFSSATESDIQRQMGSGFTTAVMKLEAGQWYGPMLSGYGVHLVYVYDFEKGKSPALAEVKDEVLEAWHEEQREAFNAEFLQALKNRYEIVIDDLPSDRLMVTPVTSVKKNTSNQVGAISELK
jgi:peptidyl-prolyl cis-trans isomerase C